MIVFYGLVKLKKKAFYTLIGLAHFTHFNVQLLILVLYTIVYVRAASRKFRVYTRHNAQKQEQVNTIVRLVMRSEMQPKLIVWWCQNERQRHTQEMPTTFLIHFNRYYSYARWIQWCQFFFFAQLGSPVLLLFLLLLLFMLCFVNTKACLYMDVATRINMLYAAICIFIRFLSIYFCSQFLQWIVFFSQFFFLLLSIAFRRRCAVFISSQLT